jgi:hypothetical protein
VEAEACDVTGKQVRKGILQTCEITGKRVLSSDLSRCSVTGKHALKGLLVSSSLSDVRMLEDVATRSAAGKFCAPAEARLCFWSGQKYHPDDLRICGLTALPIYFEFATPEAPPRLQTLVELLDGVRRPVDEPHLWDIAAARIAAALKVGKCRVEAARLSPTRQHLAACSEVKTFLGIRSRQVGGIYDLNEGTIVGRIAEGKRDGDSWVERRR